MADPSLDTACPGSSSINPHEQWGAHKDFYTRNDISKSQLFPVSNERDFTWTSPKSGGGSSDGYFANDPHGVRYYVKRGGSAAENKSEHAFNEVVTGSIYTGLHNRGVQAGPQQRIIIRTKGTGGKAQGPKRWPSGEPKPDVEGTSEILVGTRVQDGLDPKEGHPEAARVNFPPRGKVKRIGVYLKASNGEGRDDLLEAYFLDALLGSWDTVGGNVFTILPDTPTDINSNPRPLKLFKLDFGNGLEFFASGRKKHNTFGPGGPSARDAQVPQDVADIKLNRGFWPSYGSDPNHIVDEFPGPLTHPGTMRIGISNTTPPPSQFSEMRAINLYGLVSDRNIIDYWKTRLGRGNILSRYKRRIDSIISHYYVSPRSEDINSHERGRYLKYVLYHRLRQIYCELPTWLEGNISYTTENGKTLQRQYFGGKKTRRGKKNKKPKRKTIKRRNNKK